MNTRKSLWEIFSSQAIILKILVFYLSTGDCFEYTQVICPTDAQKCSTYLASNRILKNCLDRKADYLEIRYYCVPSNPDF